VTTYNKGDRTNQIRDLISERSGEKLRPKDGETSWTVRREGHSKFLLKRGPFATNRGKIIAARGFTGFAAQWPRAQRSLSADLIFGYFVSRQSNSLSGN
jgi:hypothetical protein